MELSDVELARRMAEGDEQALSLCYDRYASRLLGLLVKLVGRRDDAEDLLQTTFCQAWRCAHLYDPNRSAFRAWLFLIARSRALDSLRRRRPEAELSFDCDMANADTADVHFERAESAQRLRDAIRQLPPDQRLAIRFAFFAGLTHEQISDRLEVPLGTIKTRIRLGMNRLRNLLREK